MVEKPATISDPVVAAKVNGQPIYVEDVRSRAVQAGRLQEGEDLNADFDGFYMTLEELIQFRLFALEAEARGLDRQPDIRRRLELARERVLAAAIYEEIDRKATDPGEIERLYRENASRLGQGQEVHLRHIQFETREASEAAKRRLDNGERFEALAFELSTDRDTAADGGDLGFRAVADLTPQVREQVDRTNVGQIFGPVQVEQTWQLIRVEDRRERGVPSLETLRPRIIEWLRFQQISELQDRLERDARIERLREQAAPADTGGDVTPPADAGDTPAAPPSSGAAPNAAPGASDHPRLPGPAFPFPMGPGGVYGGDSPQAAPTPAPAAPAAPPANPRPQAPRPSNAGGPCRPHALSSRDTSSHMQIDQVSPLAPARFPDLPEIKGVEAAIGRAGFYKHERPDLLLFRCAPGTRAAGVFTSNAVGSAPTDWCKAALAAGRGTTRGVLINAGCANSFTGPAGDAAAKRSLEAAASKVGVEARELLAASTGVIGVCLDDSKISAALPAMELAPVDWQAAAEAIMTTDTFPKGARGFARIDGVEVSIAGICKGSGMIAPNMATMLAFVFTDAAISAPILKTLLKAENETSFNSITVDGDRSTNDCVILFATGQAKTPPIADANDPRLSEFRASALARARGSCDPDRARRRRRAQIGGGQCVRRIKRSGGEDHRAHHLRKSAGENRHRRRRR